MAEREELILEVEVEDNRAESTLRDIEQAAEQVEEAFEDTGTAAERAGRAIVDAADKARSEMVQEKAAVDALATALGPELAAKANLDSVVTDLQRMGLTLEDIRGEADTLAAAMKEVDDVRLQGLSQGVDITRQRMDGLTSSSNQSRSVLANLAGNSAQDIGQLGGVVGSLGVGIGQLAEYAVDGNIKLNQLASVAGPMLGLVFASQAVSTALAGIKAENAFRADLVDDFTEALRDAETAAATILETIRETGELSFSDEGGFLGLGQQAEDLLPVLSRLGLGVDDFLQLVELSTSGSREELDRFFRTLQEGSTGAFGTFNEDADALADGIDQYADSIAAAEEAQRIFNELMPETGEAATAMLEALREPTDILPELWAVLIEDAKDLKFDFENAATAITQLATATGLEREEIVAMVNERASEELAAQAEAAEAAAEAQREHAAALRETSEALAATVAAFDTATLRADGFAGALSEINSSVSELDAANETINFAESLNSLGDAIKALIDSDVDMEALDLIPDSWAEVLNMPEELGPVVDALTGFRDVMQGEFAQSFEQGGATEARAWAEDTREAIITELEEAGIESGEQVAEILKALGLLPEQVETTIRISTEAQARQVIDDIASAIETLDTEVQLQIAAVAQDDPVAALQLAIDALEGAGVTVPVSLQILQDQFEDDVDAAVSDATAKVLNKPITKVTITPELEPAQAEEDLATLTDEERTATIDTVANTRPADIGLDLVAAERRTATINAVLGDYPTADEIRRRIGTVRVPIQAFWTTRIEGNRPR